MYIIIIRLYTPKININSTGTVHPNGPRKQFLQELNTTQSFVGEKRDVMQTMDFLIALFFEWEKLLVLYKNNSVRKIVNGGLSETFVRALPYRTVWVG